MAIINGNKYSLPYSGACRLLRSLGPYKIYRIKEKKSVIYAVMRGRKVASELSACNIVVFAIVYDTIPETCSTYSLVGCI